MTTNSSTAHVSRGPVVAAGVVTAAVLVVAGWGLSAERTAAAEIGASVPMQGGLLVVASSWVVQDPMATMHGSTSQFARSGMQMSSMLPDAVPEGMKRIAVEVSLRAGVTSMAVSASGATLTDANGRRHTAYKSLLGDGALPAGAALSGVVTFEVPQDVETGLFRLDGAEQPIAISVEPIVGHDHP